MEQTEVKSTPDSGMGTSQKDFSQKESAFAGRDSVSGSQPNNSSRSTASAASQDLARELDQLLDRIPTLSGANLDKAKADFIALAARSGNAATELAAKSADVAKRVTGRVKDEWETGRERAESFVHANPIRAVGVALGIGLVLGARLFGGSHRRDGL